MKSIINVIFLLFTLSFYSQNDTISVIKHTDKDIVVNKELKIVYRGMMNSLSIEVPNCKSFKATADGLTMVSKNLYNLNPLSGSEVIINIDIVLKNGKKKKEKHVFKIKNISGFVTTINGRSGLVCFQKSSLKDAVIKIGFEDKNLSFSNKINSFSLKIPGMSSIQVIGNKIDKETFEKIIKNVSLGDQIVISDIKLLVLEESLKGGMCFQTNPIVIEIY
jgi:hypothetical protein